MQCRPLQGKYGDHEAGTGSVAPWPLEQKDGSAMHRSYRPKYPCRVWRCSQDIDGEPWDEATDEMKATWPVCCDTDLLAWGLVCGARDLGWRRLREGSRRGCHLASLG